MNPWLKELLISFLNPQENNSVERSPSTRFQPITSINTLASMVSKPSANNSNTFFIFIIYYFIDNAGTIYIFIQQSVPSCMFHSRQQFKKSTEYMFMYAQKG